MKGPTGCATRRISGRSGFTGPFNALTLFWRGFETSTARGVPHSTAQLMYLALSCPSVRRKRHESAMNSEIRRGMRNGSFPPLHAAIPDVERFAQEHFLKSLMLGGKCSLF